jgi:hypothetical protein
MKRWSNIIYKIQRVVGVDGESREGVILVSVGGVKAWQSNIGDTVIGSSAIQCGGMAIACHGEIQIKKSLIWDDVF